MRLWLRLKVENEAEIEDGDEDEVDDGDEDELVVDVLDDVEVD